MATTPPRPLTDEEKEERAKMQSILFDQMNKNYPDYTPVVFEESQRPRRLSWRVDNLFVDGFGLVTCHPCVRHTSITDPTLWPDLRRHVHFAIQQELKTGPDLYQCFCGYYSFLSEGLEKHLAISPKTATEKEKQENKQVMDELMGRIKEVGMHEACQHQLVAFVDRQEYNHRPNQEEENARFTEEDNARFSGEDSARLHDEHDARMQEAIDARVKEKANKSAEREDVA